jgi:hypothetical protein
MSLGDSNTAVTGGRMGVLRRHQTLANAPRIGVHTIRHDRSNNQSPTLLTMSAAFGPITNF